MQPPYSRLPTMAAVSRLNRLQSPFRAGMTVAAIPTIPNLRLGACCTPTASSATRARRARPDGTRLYGPADSLARNRRRAGMSIRFRASPGAPAKTPILAPAMKCHSAV